MADLALIAGVAPSAVKLDPAQRMLSVTAAPLPGLGLAGYRELEAREGRALSDWTVAITPPDGTQLPEVVFREGVVDDAALVVAAWASSRTGRSIDVSGGTPAQREAVVEGIAARGGRAQAGGADGALALTWSESGSATSPEE